MTLQEEIAELEREIKVRERVYPEWQRQGRIKKEVAAQRIALFKSTVDRLRALEKQQNGEQGSLFEKGGGE